MLLIDCSTIDVATARAMHEAAQARGLDMLDAPVSGGTPGAEAATLTFMCGGSAETFRRARPVLEGMGKNIVHCGGPGLGQVAKICNNMIAGISIIAVSEAFVLAERTGEHWSRAELLRVEGAVLRAAAAPGEVVESKLREAVDAARAQGALAFELRAVTDLARALDTRGRREEARALLARARGRLPRASAGEDQRVADALLEELARP